MRQIAKDLKFDFMALRKNALIISAVLIFISLASLGLRGLNFGIDFTGGSVIEVGYPQAVELTEIREQMAGAGYESAIVQHFGTASDVLIRIAPQEGITNAEISTGVLAALEKGDAMVEMRRVEYVGPQVGDELTEDGGLAVLYALIGILIYVSFRFEKRFAAGSVAALVHDVIITLGFFSVTQIEFDLSVLAAILAVIGYSLNDTIVVFDRIRENFRKMRKGSPSDVVNRSVNQTLARTLVTSLTTLLVLIALFLFGGEIISSFSLALIVGVLIGTYSSIYVASSAILMMGISKQDLMPVEKEGAEVDSSRP